MIIEDVAKTDAQNCSSLLPNVSDALYVIGGKWKLRIIVVLREGTKRFNEIQHVVGGISARVLSAELRALEMNGFIKRIVDTGTPVIVKYSVTDYACSLGEVLTALANWGAMHREKLRLER